MTIDKFGRTSGSTSTSTAGVTKTYVHETFLEDNPIENDVDFQNTYTCINVKDPVNDQDVTTKSYVDSIVSTNTANKAYITIIAEKSGALTGGSDDFSFGHGTQSTLVGYTMMYTGRVIAAGINIAPANYAATISITINGDIQSNYLFSKQATPNLYKGSSTIFSTPLELGINDCINFRTITATVGGTDASVNLLIELDMDS